MSTVPARRLLALLLSLVVGLVIAPLAPAQGRGAAELSFVVRSGGTSYVAGQGLFLVGNLGVRGVRQISVESNMNRPGDVWLPLFDVVFQGRTQPDGSFRLPIQAPSMFDMSYRVVGDGHATPEVLFNAKTQDLDLWVEGTQDYTRPAQPVALLPFVIVADTTPDFYHRPTTVGLPVLEGRRLTLLRRTGSGRWAEVATTRADAQGRGRFVDLLEPAGDHVYRVRAEPWTEDGSDVGWMWSWPVQVHVRGLLEPPAYEPEGPRTPGNVAGQRPPERENPNAGSRFGWSPSRWDFAWTMGQALDAPPSRGTDRSGRWTEESTGLGRVVKHNGGLLVSSGKLVRDGRGDVGTTRAVLRGATADRGRWEALMSLAVGETRSSDYDAVLELVPATGADRPCAPVVTIARWTGLGKKLTFGVANGGREWTRTVSSPGVAHSIPAVAVEVGASHLTWFLNSRPIGTVRTADAVPDTALTLRMSLEGDDSEHDNSSLFSDWQRSFPLTTGQQVTSGPALRARSRSGC